VANYVCVSLFSSVSSDSAESAPPVNSTATGMADIELFNKSHTLSVVMALCSMLNIYFKRGEDSGMVKGRER
jgi:hypothetical protein